MEKFLITAIAHMEKHTGMSTYFDFWEVAKEEEMPVPDQKSSLWQKKVFSGCQHGESSAQHFHKYDNISDYPLLLAAVTHTNFSGVGGNKKAYSEMEIAGGGHHMKQSPGAATTCDRIKIICSVDSNPKTTVAWWGVT